MAEVPSPGLSQEEVASVCIQWRRSDAQGKRGGLFPEQRAMAGRAGVDYRETRSSRTREFALP